MMMNVTEGYSLCPTEPSDTTTASRTDPNNNGTPNNNEISHQESCLWPNALQVGLVETIHTKKVKFVVKPFS